MKGVSDGVKRNFRLLCLLGGYLIAGHGPSSVSALNLSATTAPAIGIRINGGAKYTNNRTVEIEVKSLRTPDSTIDELQAGTQPDLGGASWRPYNTQKFNLELPPGDGEKHVYVRLKDKAGNLSPIESNSIILDTKAPENCHIQINQGDRFTNDKLGRVLLNLEAEGADLMMISNHQDFRAASWERLDAVKKWIIELPGDGNKTVYAKFKDFAGNESQVISAGITLDTTPPQGGTVSINDGAKYTRSREVSVRVVSKDASMIRITGNTGGENYEFTPDPEGVMALPWMLDSLDGLKVIRVYFMDEAKNRTAVPVEANIHLRRTPPAAPQIRINAGNPFTNHPKGLVDLNLSARENPQFLQMLISNDPEFKNTQPQRFIAQVKAWPLPAEEDGLKTIYLRLIDEAGNLSRISTAEIILDRTPPTIKAFRINDSTEWCNSVKVSLLFSVDDAHQMQISNAPSFGPTLPWENYREIRPDWTLPPGDGLKTVYARFKDRAENISATVNSSIRLDTKSPVGKLTINRGIPHTNHPSGLVDLEIECDDDAVAMEISNNPGFSDSKPAPIVRTLSGWDLEGEDGLKTVYLRLQDRAGNYSNVITAGIVLDRQPPLHPELVINNNQEWVTNRNKRVVLSLRAEGAVEMAISNHADFTGVAWAPYKNAISWTLEGEEGMHYVYAKFRDAAGNETEPLTSSVKSDFTPPVIRKLAINGGDEFTNDLEKRVAIDMDVEDAVDMIISNTSIRDTSAVRNSWEPYQPVKSWQLDGEDGLKTVYALFRDQAGNISAEIYDRITLDRVAPSNPIIEINKGAKWVNDPSGKSTLHLNATGADEVRLSNSTDFSQSSWEPFKPEREQWPLDLNQSSARVYAQFRDKAGNLSEVASATVLIDLDPPSNPAITVNNGQKYVNPNDRKIRLDLGADNATLMRISRYDHFRDSKWEPYSTAKEINMMELDGIKNFYAQFADEAGNISETVMASVILDTAPPVIRSFSIDGGAEWTNHPEKRVELKIEVTDGHEMMIGNDPGLEGATWQPYTAGAVDYTLPGDDGEKIIFLQVRDEAGNQSRISSAKINLKRSF